MKKSRNVYLLGAVSFLNDLSSEMIRPILPMFITMLGGNSVIVGLVGGLRDSISSILKVLGGYVSDRTGKRKIFVFFGYLISSVFKLFLGFSRTWQQVLVFSTLERTGKGIRTAPRDALISESMLKRGKAFGIHRALDTLGAIFGTIFVFVLFWFLSMSLGFIIFLAACIAFLSVIPLLFVKEQKKRFTHSFKFRFQNLPSSLKLFIFVSAIFTLSNFSYMFFILRVQEFFSGKLSIGIPILLYIIFNVFYAGFAVPFGTLSDKIGKRKIIGLGYLLFSLVSLGFVFVNSLLGFVLLFALYGLVYALVDGTQRAYVSDLSPKQLRATALGIFHMIMGLAALPASLTAGFLWQIDPSISFIYAAVGGAVSFVLLTFFID